MVKKEEEIDFFSIEKKWQEKWQKKKIFEVNPDKKRKFFINFPYPYVNAYLHLGHAFSATRVDVMARFKRMKGYNVLFPQAWHCTGTPVWAASQRVKEKEPKQIQILKNMGFSNKEINKFSEPEYWIKVFVPAARKDFTRLGTSVDWRRSFITTELNPRYDKFIRWQFRKLKEKNLVIKGKHPVVWCPKDEMPVGDHDRVEGEGEIPQEFYLLKSKFDDGFLVVATLRPETIFGETNFWLNPNINYVKAEVDGERWIVSKECSEKLRNQGKKIKIIRRIKGKELIGKYCEAPLIKKKLIILPADFANSEIGTGLVTSVPSDAPYDYVALKDLQENEQEMRKYSLDVQEIRKIKPIPIIDSEEWGDLPAVKIVRDMKIENQKDPKLEKATQTIYKAGFYSGKMNKNCGKYDSLSVEEAKKKIAKELNDKKLLDKFYELTGKVVCRCLTPSVVKIVSDQWFLKYSDKKWKDEVRKALEKMKLYPELVRQQFNYVAGWLNDWACTHHHGLGTRLPWDEKWVIESLSDSTIYMAYYTISHLLEKFPEKEINDKFFDYVFLGKGKSDKRMQKMREEFEYWYPFDIRSSGKDLVQNHLSFCLFNHTAIFPEKYWPRSFSVNGWLLVEGAKMSKSKGNFFSIREILNKYPADVLRAALILGGEGLDDPNLDFKNANIIKQKFEQFFRFVIEGYKIIKRKEISRKDKVLLSYLNKILKEGTEAMENMMFRTAFDKLFYQMQKVIREYIRKEDINYKILNEAIEMQLKVLSPLTPHLTEEIWHKLGNKTFISLEKWPEANESKIDEKLEREEEQIEKLIEDIRNIYKLLEEKEKKKANKVYLYIIPKEKELYSKEIGRIAKNLDLSVEVYAVDDKNKYDPLEKSVKAKPGRPAIYLE